METTVTPKRHAPLAMSPEQFRSLGHALVDQLAGLLAAIPDGPVTPGETPAQVRAALELDGPLPEQGADPAVLLERTASRLFAHSLFNGHPRFMGYITASPAPIAMLADLMAAAANPNCGAFVLSPAATEIERQAVRWIAEFIGLPSDCGGILVSGGNMANITCFFAARAAHAGHDVRAEGIAAGRGTMRVYASAETHTWISKAADLSGIGTHTIRWIAADARQRIDLTALKTQVAADRAAGDRPFMVVGTGGSVSTGATDDLPALSAFCKQEGLWFHVDGAYGAIAAASSEAPDDLRALTLADSVAVDPHKWLYMPLEAGCALVRDASKLRDAFSYHPPYYHLDEEYLNYVDMGPQNSRGFRALKVWLALQHAGAAGYRTMIGDDIRLSERLADAVRAHADFEWYTQDLSITTFRYVPADLRARVGTPDVEAHLDALNRELLDSSQKSGEVFVSNAVIGDRYLLRACIVNFHTQAADIDALPGILARQGQAIDQRLRPAALQAAR
jgi:glutamate/tyrosine decarboxylase-like PLP-dependent enzyme